MSTTKLGVAFTVGAAIGAATVSLVGKKLTCPLSEAARAEIMATTAKKDKSLLKLYIYDHCPYCTRARMIFGLKKIPHELVFMANHDEETPIGLVGSKQAPIFQPPTGKAMPESMDIVRHVDSTYGGAIVLAESANRPELAKWIKDNLETFRDLIYPRFHRAPMAEFAQLASREYFRIKKEKLVGTSFTALLENTPGLLKKANAALKELSTLFHSNRTVNETLSYDDIDMFGRLRVFTIVKGLNWPAKLREYIEYYEKEADIPLLFAMARE